jgi:hypothetical protein
MLAEKASDPSPRFFRRLFVIPNANHSQRVEPPSAGIVQKRVPRFRKLFHVVRDICLGEPLLKLLRDASVPAVLGPVAGDDRACLRKKAPGIHFYWVVLEPRNLSFVLSAEDRSWKLRY